MVFYNLLELCVDVVRGNNFEYESHTSIEHLWRRQLSVLNTNEEVYEGEWKRNLMQHSIAEIMIEVWNHKAPEQKCKWKEGESKEVAARAMEIMYAYIQQKIHNNNIKKQKTELNCEMEEFSRQLMRISKWKYQRMKKNINSKVQFSKDVFKVRQMKRKQVWDPERLKTTIQQCSRARGTLQYQVWDPRGKNHIEDI